MKSATLDLIAKANNKLTGDEILAVRRTEEKKAATALMDAAGVYMNSAKRRKLRKVINRTDEEKE